MSVHAKALIDVGNTLFKGRAKLDSFRQTIAEIFYPARADFIGTNFALDNLAANGLDDAYPALMHRELGGIFSTMLRPRGARWATRATGREDIDAIPEVQQYQEEKSTRMFRALYDAPARFVRAAKSTDMDYAAFGEGVLSAEITDRGHLFYRNHHLRDCAYLHDSYSKLNYMHRKDTMTARNLIERFPKADHHSSVRKAADKEPGKAIKIRHITMPAPDDKDGFPFVSIYIDADNSVILQERKTKIFNYILPQWETLSGTRFAYSPAAIISFPDARMLQQLSSIMIEAAELRIQPPMVAYTDALRSDINVFPGGVTDVAGDYDARQGKPLEPMDFGTNVNIGVNMRQDVRSIIELAWYRDKINLPAQGDMTAFEFGERVKEMVRTSLPLFEPMEMEYNTPLLDMTHDLAETMGAFIDLDEDKPRELDDMPVIYKYDSPISAAADRQKLAQFQESFQLITSTGKLGEQVSAEMDLKKALEDAIRGTGAPGSWWLDEAEREQVSEEEKQKQQVDAIMGDLGNVADAASVGSSIAKSTQDLEQAGLLTG